MLSKKERINREDFKKTLLKSKKIEGENFSARVRFVEKGEKSHFSTVVSAKVSKKAIERNRLKRRVYEVLAKKAPKQGLFCVIYAKKPAIELDFKAINKGISELLTNV